MYQSASDPHEFDQVEEITLLQWIGRHLSILLIQTARRLWNDVDIHY
jgi:hypothetical protein